MLIWECIESFFSVNIKYFIVGVTAPPPRLHSCCSTASASIYCSADTAFPATFHPGVCVSNPVCLSQCGEVAWRGVAWRGVAWRGVVCAVPCRAVPCCCRPVTSALPKWQFP